MVKLNLHSIKKEPQSCSLETQLPIPCAHAARDSALEDREAKKIIPPLKSRQCSELPSHTVLKKLFDAGYVNDKFEFLDPDSLPSIPELNENALKNLQETLEKEVVFILFDSSQYSNSSHTYYTLQLTNAQILNLMKEEHEKKLWALRSLKIQGSGSSQIIGSKWFENALCKIFPDLENFFNEYHDSSIDEYISDLDVVIDQRNKNKSFDSEMIRSVVPAAAVFRELIHEHHRHLKFRLKERGENKTDIDLIGFLELVDHLLKNKDCSYKITILSNNKFSKNPIPWMNGRFLGTGRVNELRRELGHKMDDRPKTRQELENSLLPIICKFIFEKTEAEMDQIVKPSAHFHSTTHRSKENGYKIIKDVDLLTCIGADDRPYEIFSIRELKQPTKRVEFQKIRLEIKDALFDSQKVMLKATWQAILDKYCKLIRWKDLEHATNLCWAFYLSQVTQGGISVIPGTFAKLVEKLSSSFGGVINASTVIHTLNFTLQKSVNQDPQYKAAYIFNSCYTFPQGLLENSEIAQVWDFLSQLICYSDESKDCVQTYTQMILDKKLSYCAVRTVLQRCAYRWLLLPLAQRERGALQVRMSALPDAPMIHMVLEGYTLIFPIDPLQHIDSQFNSPSEKNAMAVLEKMYSPPNNSTIDPDVLFLDYLHNSWRYFAEHLFHFLNCFNESNQRETIFNAFASAMEKAFPMLSPQILKAFNENIRGMEYNPAGYQRYLERLIKVPDGTAQRTGIDLWFTYGFEDGSLTLLEPLRKGPTSSSLHYLTRLIQTQKVAAVDPILAELENLIVRTARESDVKKRLETAYGVAKVIRELKKDFPKENSSYVHTILCMQNTLLGLGRTDAACALSAEIIAMDILPGGEVFEIMQKLAKPEPGESETKIIIDYISSLLVSKDADAIQCGDKLKKEFKNKTALLLSCDPKSIKVHLENLFALINVLDSDEQVEVRKLTEKVIMAGKEGDGFGPQQALDLLENPSLKSLYQGCPHELLILYKNCLSACFNFKNKTHKKAIYDLFRQALNFALNHEGLLSQPERLVQLWTELPKPLIHKMSEVIKNSFVQAIEKKQNNSLSKSMLSPLIKSIVPILVQGGAECVDAALHLLDASQFPENAVWLLVLRRASKMANPQLFAAAWSKSQAREKYLGQCQRLPKEEKKFNVFQEYETLSLGFVLQLYLDDRNGQHARELIQFVEGAKKNLQNMVHGGSTSYQRLLSILKVSTSRVPADCYTEDLFAAILSAHEALNEYVKKSNSADREDDIDIKIMRRDLHIGSEESMSRCIPMMKDLCERIPENKTLQEHVDLMLLVVKKGRICLSKYVDWVHICQHFQIKLSSRFDPIPFIEQLAEFKDYISLVFAHALALKHADSFKGNQKNASLERYLIGCHTFVKTVFEMEKTDLAPSSLSLFCKLFASHLLNRYPNKYEMLITVVQSLLKNVTTPPFSLLSVRERVVDNVKTLELFDTPYDKKIQCVDQFLDALSVQFLVPAEENPWGNRGWDSLQTIQNNFFKEIRKGPSFEFLNQARPALAALEYGLEVPNPKFIFEIFCSAFIYILNNKFLKTKTILPEVIAKQVENLSKAIQPEWEQFTIPFIKERRDKCLANLMMIKKFLLLKPIEDSSKAILLTLLWQRMAILMQHSGEKAKEIPALIEEYAFCPASDLNPFFHFHYSLVRDLVNIALLNNLFSSDRALFFRLLLLLDEIPGKILLPYAEQIDEIYAISRKLSLYPNNERNLKRLRILLASFKLHLESTPKLFTRYFQEIIATYEACSSVRENTYILGALGNLFFQHIPKDIPEWREVYGDCQKIIMDLFINHLKVGTISDEDFSLYFQQTSDFFGCMLNRNVYQDKSELFVTTFLQLHQYLPRWNECILTKTLPDIPTVNEARKFLKQYIIKFYYIYFSVKPEVLTEEIKKQSSPIFLSILDASLNLFTKPELWSDDSQKIDYFLQIIHLANYWRKIGSFVNNINAYLTKVEQIVSLFFEVIPPAKENIENYEYIFALFMTEEFSHAFTDTQRQQKAELLLTLLDKGDRNLASHWNAAAHLHINAPGIKGTFHKFPAIKAKVETLLHSSSVIDSQG